MAVKIVKYILRKGKEYFFPVIDNKLMEESLKILTEEEKRLFMEMDTYDKGHSLEVYRKLGETPLKDKSMYMRLALLHDCGKGRNSIIIRMLHKIGITTSLRNHPYKGYEKVKKYDGELALLVKNHHVKGYSREMDIFQMCDDRS